MDLIYYYYQSYYCNYCSDVHYNYCYYYYVKRTPVRCGEALIHDSRTHDKFIQVLQGPEQDEQCAPLAGEPTEQCAQHASELRARGNTEARWNRPLMAVTNGRRCAGGTGAT